MISPQVKPFRWACGVTAFAMAIDLPVNQFVDEIGHDGSEVICPSLPEPSGRRGFHEQECITVALNHGFACTLIEALPASLFANGHKQVVLFPHDAATLGGNRDRFTRYIRNSRGVLTGKTRQARHAVAFDHGLVIDPDNGSTFPFSFEACESRGFFPSTLWRVDRITE
jgi:hypothetical protein